MSLRDTLTAAVARCAPQGTQHATIANTGATVYATGTQQQADSPRHDGATATATGAQLGSCEGAATTPRIRPRSCASCEHMSRVKSCRAPVAADLLTKAEGFGIVWPPEGHGAVCTAFRGKTASNATPRPPEPPKQATNDASGADNRAATSLARLARLGWPAGAAHAAVDRPSRLQCPAKLCGATSHPNTTLHAITRRCA